MAKEPENLVLEHLRLIRADVKELRGEMRGELDSVRTDLRDIRKVQDDHTLRFDYLEERVEMLREGTLTAIGFAASAGESQKKLEKPK